MSSEAQVLTSHLLREWALPPAGGGKDGRGRVLVVGGSRSTPGAVLLAAEAALRAGAGKLQIATGTSVGGPSRKGAGKDCWPAALPAPLPRRSAQ